MFNYQVLEDKKEIDLALSETLNNSDSDIELEKELAELLSDHNVEDTITVSDSNPEVNELEQRLKGLRTEGKYYETYYYIVFHIK